MRENRLVPNDTDAATVYRAVFDRALDAILLADDHLRFVDANAAATQLTGYSREELLRMRVSDLSPAPLREAIVANWRAFLDSGEQSGRFELQTKDGRVLVLQYRAVAHIAPGLHLSMLRDITHEQQVEGARKYLETLGAVQYAASRILATRREVDTAAPLILRAIGEAIGWPFAALWLFDEERDALRAVHTWAANRSFAPFDRMTRGAHPRVGEPSIPATVFGTVRPLWVSDIARDDRKFFRAQVAGETHLCCALAVPVASGDTSALGVLEMFTTEPREPDQALIDALSGVGHQMAEHLERVAAERAERESIAAANRLKDDFLAIVSHELRTPLNAILGWSRLMRAGQLDEQGRTRAIEIIERNVQAQSQIIEDLLDVSRIVTGRLRLEITRVDLARVATEVVESLAPAADAKEITVTRDLDEAMMSGDPNRLQQITWNLVSNAIKFTPRGGRVDVQVRRTHEWIDLMVADTGSGIQPAMLPRVFDRFLQQDSSTTRQHGGLGLGLAIVRHLVELHGGSVSAESAGPGQGATFRIRFPVTPSDGGHSRRS